MDGKLVERIKEIWQTLERIALGVRDDHASSSTFRSLLAGIQQALKMVEICRQRGIGSLDEFRLGIRGAAKQLSSFAASDELAVIEPMLVALP